MPRTEVIWGPHGIKLYGEYQYTPDEANPYDGQQVLWNLYYAWPFPEFWEDVDRAVMWSLLRSDRPEKFRIPDANGRVAGAQYTPGTPAWFDFNADQFAFPQSIDLGFHEGGHRFQHRYNAWGTDDAAQAFQFALAESGIDTMERVASAVGAVFQRRIGLSPKDPVIPGLGQMMLGLRRARLTP